MFQAAGWEDFVQFRAVRAARYAPRVSPSYVGIGNEVSSARSSISYARDTSLGGIESNEHYMDLISLGFRSADQIRAISARESCFYSETHATIEIVRDSPH